MSKGCCFFWPIRGCGQHYEHEWSLGSSVGLRSRRIALGLGHQCSPAAFAGEIVGLRAAEELVD